ncbi:MAG: hypothetical protein JNK61_11645 [Bacteroidia bacterium]|nr:hypothetical protein [Bacteroidia bacterium]
MRKLWSVFVLSIGVILGKVYAQHEYILLSKDIIQRYEPYTDAVGSAVHTSFKPLYSADIVTVAPYDSLNTKSIKSTKFNQSWWGRKLHNEHLLQYKKDDVYLYADFLFNFSLTNEFQNNETYVTNSRGVMAGGTLGKGFSFNSYFFENQIAYPTYIDSSIKVNGVIPGQGRGKNFNSSKDFAFAAAHVAYATKKYFKFQLGTDKNFIGEGYRSLLLSDYAFYYPYFKIETQVWKMKYTCMWTAYQDLRIGPPHGMDPDDFNFRKKYATYHYLDFNIGKSNRASIGIMEAVIWRSDSIRGRGIDFNYLNPIIFLRPVEFSMSSADNVLLGLNTKFKINSKNILYGQLSLDEFNLTALKNKDGDYRNKFGFQLGYKSYHVFGIKNLRFQTEFNYVKPYTFQHRSSLTNYGHYNEALAHVQGANFYESVTFINYQFKNWFFQLQGMYVATGLDTAGINFGKNIFDTYTQPAQFTGNKMLQGLQSTITYFDFKIAYLINPKYNLRFECGATSRTLDNDLFTQKSTFVYAGIRTTISNQYFDF